MASVNILDIISSGAIKQTESIINTPLQNADTILSKTFLDAIRNGTKILSDTNCADKIVNNTIHGVGDTFNSVGNFFEDNFKIKNIVRNVGSLGDFAVVDSKITSFICHTINSSYKALIAILQPLLKTLLLILRKIDKLRTKVEKALIDFSKQLRDCFIRIVLDAKFGLEKIVRKSMDFNGLLELMKQCPCIMELIQEKFTACADLTTPEQVISCLQNQYRFSPNQLLDQLNEWTRDSVLDPINDGFNVMDEAIRNILESIMVPFRNVVKQYCRELNRKHNVDFLLAKDPSIRCLFVYTKEFDSAGKEYFGMSVIDMLNTMKKWSVCIDFVCSTLHDDIKRKIQDYNEQLKLDFKYWNDEITMDIYFACIAANLDGEYIRPTVIREIYTKNKGKGVFIGLIDFYKDIGKLTLEKGTNPQKTLGDVATKILDQTNSQENADLSIVDGDELFKVGIEDLIIKLYLNMATEIEKDFYYRKIIELGDWDFRFKKSQKYVDAKRKMNSDFQNILNGVATKPEVATVEINGSQRVEDSESYAPQAVPNLPTYVAKDDYAYLSVKPKPKRIDGESLAAFYKRWYRLSAAQ